ncbi:RluA family pseudouridine synthase [Ilumatobacter sp.]|uniref:RluA family pseudouridine synthase n=1 Tax=Ilumatobacter sp. TaxID=1967498 RepID=UPI003B523184
MSDEGERAEPDDAANPIREVVPAALDGQRLDRIVSLVADVSRSEAAATIDAGGVRVDGAEAPSGKVRLAEGQEVAVDVTAIPVVEMPGPDPHVTFGVVHVDDSVVVVDKPPGLVVHPGSGNRSGTLANGLLARFPDVVDVGDRMRPGIVHRLDAGSSGLLVVARTQHAADALSAQFVDHSAGRTYDAVVWGVPEATHGIIDAPLGRSRSDPLRMAVVADGRPSRTDYRVISAYSEPTTMSRVECRLETGRTHQIRVHLSSIGHPLIGDPVYGQRRPHLGLERPFLHATELEFTHPTSGERVAFRSPLAPDLRAWLDAAS